MAKWPYSTAAWQRLREAKLSASPLCEACMRREVVTPANTVDHIVAIAKGGEAFPPLNGLMSLCASCHNAKTMAKDVSTAGLRRALRGFDLEGNPVDPEGWDEPSASGCVAPGAPRGRERPDAGPRAPSNVDLVSCESFATSTNEASQWV